MKDVAVLINTKSINVDDTVLILEAGSLEMD
jgi:hypothetical protein